MIYTIIILLFWLWGYIYFFYKNKWFSFYNIYWIPVFFLLSAFCLSIISFFSYKIDMNEKNKFESSDIVFIIDVSKSMLALDVWEQSRLQIAKEFVLHYVHNHLANNYWLNIFAWESIQLLPITEDENLFTTFLESIDEKSILEWWSSIIESLKLSLLRLKKSENGWAIIVLSDFETHASTFDKQELIKKIEEINTVFLEKNIKLIFIWVGSKLWNKIPEWYDLFWKNIYKKDKNNREIITKFDEDFFSAFSFDTYKINNSQDIWKIEIKNIPATNIDSENNKKMDISRYIMIVSFFFFLIYLVLFSYFDKKWK